MTNLKKWLHYLSAFIMGCTFFAANAQTPNLNGTWVGKLMCPIGLVEFTIDVQDKEGTLSYDGYGPQKLYATSFPMKVTHRWSDMYVQFSGPKPGADFGSFAGSLLADGTIANVLGIKVNGVDCTSFPLIRKEDLDQSAKAPGFNAQGLNHEGFVTRLMQGNFAATSITPDSPLFNGLYGSYLYAYARQCAADPKTRPKDFVEMTNLQCVQQGITTTYYRNGAFSESAPYCTQWKDILSGSFADPKMWEEKKKLDTVFLGDTYKHMFAATKGFGLEFGGAVMPNPRQIAEAAVTRAKDMEALVKTNGCNSPGLMRFQENLRLFAMSRPFGIRPNGSLEPPIPIPSPGKAFEDPNYVALLEELIKGEARSWQVYKYVLKSIANPTITSRDALGRPLDISAKYRFAGMDDFQTGSMRVTFIDGYPACLYFWDKPNSCRVPNKMVVSKYVYGAFSPQNTAVATPVEDPLVQAKNQKEREQAQQSRRDAREAARRRAF